MFDIQDSDVKPLDVNNGLIVTLLSSTGLYLK